MEKSSVAITVAVIGAVASIAAALVSSNFFSKDAASIAVEARVEAKNAVALAASKGTCREGSELEQFHLDRPIEVENGAISLTTTETSVRQLPQAVPPKAQFIQVLATITTGNAHQSLDGFLKITGKNKDFADCSAYLFFRAHDGSFFAYNSTMSWLPVAPDRKLSASLISLDGTPAASLGPEASATARLFVTAYR